ncbi:MAG: hypothetical protein JRC54_00880 [Deltaproteobacteria bacterium]|jgi:hypothetical protein|nr:hypothetical protein [Deltaproteobacteria bacterium]MBW2579707.1 hypothetical protein [Deltaproteobacteria bacterium]MBW2624743.1 hypothetical protein [Deltaproteobacteria bacterium]
MSKEVVMEFNTFLEKCQSEPTVSDFESYLAYCIFEKKSAETSGKDEVTVEMYSSVRDQAFERRDEQAARLLYDLGDASSWKEGEWEGALR